MKHSKTHRRILTWTIIVFLTIGLFSCKEDRCVSCIAQGKASKNIIDHDIFCDKNASVIDGFIEGFEFSYEERGDTVIVVCERYINS